jgi:hypothetical protein
MRMPRKPGDYVRVHEGRVQQWMAPVSLDAVWPLIAAIADRPPLAWLATFRPPLRRRTPDDGRASVNGQPGRGFPRRKRSSLLGL